MGHDREREISRLAGSGKSSGLYLSGSTRVARVTMSSLESHRQLFVVQSGVVAWEDPQPIIDWTCKTVTVVSSKLSFAIALLWAILASRPDRFGRVFRLYLAPTAPEWTENQKRRLMAALRVDPPGFSETTLKVADLHVCVVSALSDPSAVDPGFLTDYRHCALVGVDESTTSEFEPLGNVCPTIGHLANSGISKLLAGAKSVAVLRVLDRESHAVMQIIGSSEVSDAAVRCLTERGVRRLHDIRTLPPEIASFRE